MSATPTRPATRPPDAPMSGATTFLTLALSALLLSLLFVLVGCGRDASQASTMDSSADVGSKAERQPGERVVSVRARRLSSETVVEVASLPAELLPSRRAMLAAEVAGVVDSRRVDDGAQVRAGKTLATIDTRGSKQRLAEAEAVDRQRRLQFDRAQKLLEKRSITQVQFLDAQTARNVAAAHLESARLEVEKSQVRAPWSGTVVVMRAEVGDYLTPGMPVAELVDVQRLEVRATAPSSDVPYLRPGMPVEIHVDVFPDQPIQGKVTRLGTELDPSARTLDVVAEIGNSAGQLRPGLSARLTLPRRELVDAIRVPLDAVVELEDHQVAYVAVEEGGGHRAEQRQIRLGPIIGSQGVVVEEGLAAGDLLIVSGQRRVSPGQKVELEEIDTPSAIDAGDGESL